VFLLCISALACTGSVFVVY